MFKLPLTLLFICFETVTIVAMDMPDGPPSDTPALRYPQGYPARRSRQQVVLPQPTDPHQSAMKILSDINRQLLQKNQELSKQMAMQGQMEPQVAQKSSERMAVMQEQIAELETILTMQREETVTSTAKVDELSEQLQKMSTNFGTLLEETDNLQEKTTRLQGQQEGLTNELEELRQGEQENTSLQETLRTHQGLLLAHNNKKNKWILPTRRWST